MDKMEKKTHVLRSKYSIKTYMYISWNTSQNALKSPSKTLQNYSSKIKVEWIFVFYNRLTNDCINSMLFLYFYNCQYFDKRRWG